MYQLLCFCAGLARFWSTCAPQKSPHVQSCINFFSSFGSKAPQASEAATAVAEGLLTHLARHSAAADKSVRFHACQLLHQLLGQLPASVLSDDAVLDSLTEALLERLQDKQPGIRAEAVRGLCDLAGFYEVRSYPASVLSMP